MPSQREVSQPSLSSHTLGRGPDPGLGKEGGGKQEGSKAVFLAAPDRLDLPLRRLNRLLESSASALLGGSGMRSGHQQGLCPKMAVASV